MNALRKYSKETYWIETRINPAGWLDLVQIYPLYETLWEEEEFKRIIEDGEAYKAEVRAQVDQMVLREGFVVY